VRPVLAIINDVLIAATATVLVFVMVSGGGMLLVGPFRLSIRSPDNPIIIFSLLWAVRYLIRDWAPWFGIPRWPTSALWQRSRELLSSATSWSRAVGAPRGRRVMLGLAVLSLGLKAWFALVSPGFFSGDDVEIHEMSLGTLLHQPWAVCDRETGDRVRQCRAPQTDLDGVRVAGVSEASGRARQLGGDEWSRSGARQCVSVQ
jgi:hypothetical protein